MALPQLHILSSGGDIQKEVCAGILDCAAKSVADHGFFSIGLSGGSVAKIVSQGFSGSNDVDWKSWRVFFCDERLVPFNNDDSTYAFFKREFFDKVNFPPENVFPIDPTLDVGGAAEDYVAKIRKVYPGNEVPSFDLLLLGMGPDGHTCSLFPDHPALQEENKMVVPITDSPKPPPSRITLTIPVLNKARNVFVISTGGAKAEAVKGCLEPDVGTSPLPAGLARPSNGQLHWYLDTPAAEKLANK